MSKPPMILTLLAVLFIFQARAAFATDYYIDSPFGNAGHGQSRFDLGDANSRETWALRIFERPAGAGFFILARHAHGNGTWDAVVLAVDAQGKNEKKYLIPTPMFRLDGATRDAGNGKFYFVGGAKRTGRPDSDFAVTCMDITIGSSGGPCSGFGTGGTVLTSFDLGGSKDDVARRVISRPGTGIIVAGWAKDGANRYVFAVAAYYRDSGALLTRFGTGGKFNHDVYQPGNASLDVNVFDIALSDHPAEDTIIYIAGDYSRVPAHNEYTGLVMALRGWDGTLAPFGTYGYRQINAGLGNCAVNCNESISAISVKHDGSLAFAGSARDRLGNNLRIVGGMMPSGALDTRLCHGAGVCQLGYTFPDRGSGNSITPYAIAEHPMNRDLVVSDTTYYANSTVRKSYYGYLVAGRKATQRWDYGGNFGTSPTWYESYPADTILVGNKKITVGTYGYNEAVKDYRIAIASEIDLDSIFFDQFGGQRTD